MLLNEYKCVILKMYPIVIADTKTEEGIDRNEKNDYLCRNKYVVCDFVNSVFSQPRMEESNL